MYRIHCSVSWGYTGDPAQQAIRRLITMKNGRQGRFKVKEVLQHPDCKNHLRLEGIQPHGCSSISIKSNKITWRVLGTIRARLISFSQICEPELNLPSCLVFGLMVSPQVPPLLWLGLTPGGLLAQDFHFCPRNTRGFFPPMPKFSPRRTLGEGGTAHVQSRTGCQIPCNSSDYEPWKRRKRAWCTSSRFFCPKTGRKPCMKDSLRHRYSPGCCFRTGRASSRGAAPPLEVCDLRG